MDVRRPVVFVTEQQLTDMLNTHSCQPLVSPDTGSSVGDPTQSPSAGSGSNAASHSLPWESAQPRLPDLPQGMTATPRLSAISYQLRYDTEGKENADT